MKRISIFVMLFCLFAVSGCGDKGIPQKISYTNSPGPAYDVAMKRDILCLMMAYPEHITGVVCGSEGSVYLVMKSGKRILYDDKRVKSFDGKINNSDLQDMMEQIYPLSDISSLMPENIDPGRFRTYSLLNEVYGKSKEQVQSNLVNVKVGYKNFLFNKSNKAADSLKSVMKELITAVENSQNVHSFVFPANGTFNYRNISGTSLLSAHSFGIAIDLKSDKRDYWKWTNRKDGEKRMLSYPREIVRIFEKYGFIWGGKWGHFDILHFEYRPELIFKSRYFADKPGDMEPWHDGVPDEYDVKNYIRLIEEVIK